MTKPVIVFLAMASLWVCGCAGNRNKSDEIRNYAYEESSEVLGPRLQEKLGGWIGEGVVCYGLVVGVDNEGKITGGKPVKARVVSLRSDSIRMKALEMVSLAEVKGCTKMGLARGETWWETEGDLFKTEEEARHYLAEKGWDLK